jgi:hypothetical protein
VIIGRRRMIMRVFVSALFAVAVVIPPALADEREDAYASIERWSEAFNSGDVEQIVRMYTNDALVFGILSPGMTTKSDDPRAYFKAAAAAKLQVRLGDHSAVALAEDAVVIAGFYDFSTPAGGQLLLSLHVLASSWSRKTAFGRSLIIIPRCGRNRLSKTRR